MRLGWRKPTSAVKWLLIANIAVYFIQVLSQNWSQRLFIETFGLSLYKLQYLHVWQFVTYMFIHGDTWHLLFNMIGLYVFGTEFERAFGKRRFLQFYFACGIVGGVAYLVLTVVNPAYQVIPLVGASGAIYGLLVAAIIFFPHIQIILLVFPVPIRVFGMIIAGMLLLNILAGDVRNLGGEVCHVAGAAAGLAIFYLWGMLPGFGGKSNPGKSAPYVPPPRKARRPQQGAWAQKQKEKAELQAEVDRILAKVHSDGIASLTRKEKKTLSEATQRQRDEESKIDHL
jgi:membrane associated rhomboid family serine protease